MGQRDIGLEAVTKLIGLVGASIAVFKFLGECQKENETARIESPKPFFNKQQEIYFDLVVTDEIINNRFDEPEWPPAMKHFRALFGLLPMVGWKMLPGQMTDLHTL